MENIELYLRQIAVALAAFVKKCGYAIRDFLLGGRQLD